MLEVRGCTWLDHTDGKLQRGGGGGRGLLCCEEEEEEDSTQQHSTSGQVEGFLLASGLHRDIQRMHP